MTKDKAIALLGGSVRLAAAAIGITVQAVGQWPDELPPKIVDRVIAALARKRFDFDQMVEGPVSGHVALDDCASGRDAA